MRNKLFKLMSAILMLTEALSSAHAMQDNERRICEYTTQPLMFKVVCRQNIRDTHLIDVKIWPADLFSYKLKQFPSEIIGFGKDGILATSFESRSDLKSVIIGKNVSFIGERAFGDCQELTKVVFTGDPFSGGLLHGGRFLYCTKLTTVIGLNVTTVGASDFRACYSLVNLDLPKVTRIKKRAFANCKNIQTVYFRSLEYVEEEAFENCFELELFYAPQIDFVSNSAFKGCQKLQPHPSAGQTTIENGRRREIGASGRIYSDEAIEENSAHIPFPFMFPFLSLLLDPSDSDD